MALNDFCLLNNECLLRFFEGSNACAEFVLQILLEKSDLSVEDVCASTCGKKISAMLDVTARDGEGTGNTG